MTHRVRASPMQQNSMPIFVVYARRTPEILGRVVSLFHRRAIEIERLTAERAKESNVLRIAISVEADAEESRRIQANFYKLVDVLWVEMMVDGMYQTKASP